MRKFVSTVLVVCGAGAAMAADLPDRPAPAPRLAVWTWTGVYFGGHLGGGLGATTFSDPAGPAIYGGDVRTPAVRGGVQVGYNWQAPNADWVLGAEAEISALKADGTNTCLASSGAFLSANCQVNQTALGSLTGRVGYAAGLGGRTLLYAKGGAAWLNERIDIASNPLIFATGQTSSLWGWTVGAGLEQAIAPAWSVKMEYDYANFGQTAATTPASYRQVSYPFDYVSTPQGRTGVAQSIQTFKVGLNMKFGGDAYARWEGLDDYHLRGALRAEHPPSRGEIEIGGRVWYSSGRFQKDLGATASPQYQNVLNSRLTYANTAASAEMFGRIDGPSDIFLKGFVGGGSLLSGKMNDEDWLIGDVIPYSNTLSDPVTGTIGYGTIDAGYAFLRGPGFKVGGFVGYNYYREKQAAYGCTQIANQNAGCVPAIANTTPVITEDGKWNSLRIGVNGVIPLTDRLKLSADAAYLPYVRFSGVDNHLLRTDVPNTLSTESGTGQGVQLEAILSYAISRSFSVGAGGRYWSMWATNSDAVTNIFGTACPCQTLPARTERYGGFLEASYKFGGL